MLLGVYWFADLCAALYFGPGSLLSAQPVKWKQQATVFGGQADMRVLRSWPFFRDPSLGMNGNRALCPSFLVSSLMAALSVDRSHPLRIDFCSYLQVCQTLRPSCRSAKLFGPVANLFAAGDLDEFLECSFSEAR